MTRADRAAIVQQRKQRRLRKKLAKHFEHLLAAAHSGQPVVNEGDSRVTMRCYHPAR